MSFKRDLALQNIPLSKQLFKTQPQIENEDVTWSPQYNMPTTRTTSAWHLLLQEVELDGWFWNLHIVLKTCTTSFMHTFNTSFLFHSYILGLTYIMDLNQPFNWRAEIWQPFIMKLIWGLQSWPLVAERPRMPPMIGENRQLVTNDPVGVEDCRKFADHSRWIHRIYPNLLKENRRMWTCNRLDLQNTRISTGYVQKSPQTLHGTCVVFPAGESGIARQLLTPFAPICEEAF